MDKKVKDVDILIIGAGAAGLYAAHQLTKLHNSSSCNKNIIVVEAADEIGGRAREKLWNGVRINIGAEHIRENDTHVRRLIDHSGIEEKYFKDIIMEVKSEKNEEETKYDILNMMNQIVTQSDRETMDMETWIKKNRLVADYGKFINDYGYTDFEKSDIVDTLTNYGFLDFFGKNKFSKVLWNKLWEKIADELDIELNSTVTSIEKINGYYICKINDKKVYKCEKVYIATPLTKTRTLVRNFPTKAKLLDQIGYYKFVKIFIKTKDVISEHHMCHTWGYVQRLIKYSDYLYCIYADSKKATYLLQGIEDIAWMELQLRLSLGNKTIEILDLYPVYWNCGTHYYKPLPSIYDTREKFIREVQHFDDNLYIIGEMISKNQGWVEGAIESFHQIHGYESHLYDYVINDVNVLLDTKLPYVLEIKRKKDGKPYVLVKNKKLIDETHINNFSLLRNKNIIDVVEKFNINGCTYIICDMPEKQSTSYTIKEIFSKVILALMEISRNEIAYTYGDISQIFFLANEPYILPLFLDENIDNLKNFPFIIESSNDLNLLNDELDDVKILSEFISIKWFDDLITSKLKNIFYINKNITHMYDVEYTKSLPHNKREFEFVTNQFPFEIEYLMPKYGYGINRLSSKSYEIWKPQTNFTCLIFIENKKFKLKFFSTKDDINEKNVYTILLNFYRVIV